MSNINRRNFIKGSGLAGLACLSGIQLGFANPMLQGNTNSSNRDLLVYVFLAGGMDGLHMLPPRSGSDYDRYRALRPNLHIPSSVSLPLNGQNAFGLHPSAPHLANLFNNNKMAIVHATGLAWPNRSHFEAVKFMGLGSQTGAANVGWMTRYFNSSLLTPDDAVIPSFVPGSSSPIDVLGDPSALVMSNPENFSLSDGHWAWGDHAQGILTGINADPTSLEQLMAHQTLKASDIIQDIEWGGYVPGNSVSYSPGFGNRLKTIAQLYKSNVNLEAAYVALAGWDTHTDQRATFSTLANSLSKGLSDLYQDLTATHEGKFTIVVHTEFGRRVYENSDTSTDHGYGTPMFIIGDNVNGGFHGEFPGLAESQVVGPGDLDATVDYRDVMSEILLKRQKNPQLGYIFPGYSEYNPLGVVNGANLTPNYNPYVDAIFASGFE